MTFPSGLKVDLKVDAVTEEYKGYIPRNDADEKEWRRYEGPERYEGAPIALQVAGRHFKDEETLAAAKILEEIIRDRKNGSAL